MVSVSDEQKAPADGECYHIPHYAPHALGHESYMVVGASTGRYRMKSSQGTGATFLPAAINAAGRQVPGLLCLFIRCFHNHIMHSFLNSRSDRVLSLGSD